jgi:hypothetical protein
MPSKSFRRHFLKAGFGFVGAASSTILLNNFAIAFAQTPTQRNWAYCTKCHILFFDGHPVGKGSKGVCAAGGEHEKAGYNFELPYNITETSTAQKSWRNCGKCQAMFFNGGVNKGRCAAGGSHEKAGYNFVLSHDVPAAQIGGQDRWRYCAKCMSMFFNGYAEKGVCPAGEGHEQAGYNFVLKIYQDPDVKK